MDTRHARRVRPVLTMLIAAVVLVGMSVPGYAAGNAKRGKRQYDQYCTPCHGKKGEGDGTRMKVEKFDPAPRNHTDGKYMNKRTDLQLFKTIKEGGKAMNFSHIMPQWKHILSDKQIWDVVAYIRTLAVNPPWSGKPDPPDPGPTKK